MPVAANAEEAPAPAAHPLESQAEAGDGEAAKKLGVMRLRGEGGFTKDEAEAMRWFTLGAANGSTDSLYYLGVCYVRGEGVATDAGRGIELIKAAAYRGSDLATAFLRELENK